MALPCSALRSSDPFLERGAGAQGSRQARLPEEPYLGRQKSFLARASGFLRPLGHTGGQDFS